MKTEISRDSHQPEKRYSGVYQQQGRMLTDADWNELVDILKEQLNDALKDVVGNGSPLHRNVVNNDTGMPKLQWGYLYVDGVQAMVRPDATSPPDFRYNSQEDFPSPPALPVAAVPYYLYADVWERTVTQLTDERLRDKGLHGADTCTRQQVLAQIKWCPVTIEPETAAENPSKGNAKATITLLKKSTQPDPCDPCVEQIEVKSRVGNYLFRVEIHDVKGSADAPTEITLKWSGENGAIQYGADDAPEHFTAGGWAYEFFDETSERHLGVHHAAGFPPDRPGLVNVYPTTVPKQNVRRWDGYCTLLINDGSRSISTQYDKDFKESSFASVAGSQLTIKLAAQEIVIKLGTAIMAGDYWLAEVREAEHEPGVKLITDALPCGIDHRYLRLGKVAGGVLQTNPEADRKYAFPPLTEMTHMFIAGGDGQEVQPGAPLKALPQPLRVAVANGEWPVAGAQVRFTTANGSLSPASGIVTTGPNGIAECSWTPGGVGIDSMGNWPKFEVKVTLVDPFNSAVDLDHPPVYFYANLVSANQVAYAPHCMPDADAATVHHLLLGPDSTKLGTDGYYMVKEVLDALLCELKADHIPYVEPACAATTSVKSLLTTLDINSDGHITVKDVLDTLLCKLKADHIPYDEPTCAITPSVKSLLSSLDINSDGHITVKDVLDTLLCKLTAAHVPYDPAIKGSRWDDVNAEEGVSRPLSVQEAIDDLVDNLQSEDIKYTPSCAGDIPATVRSMLAIPTDTPSRVHDILNKLLCELDAGKIPYGAGCDFLEGKNTVKDAIDALCSRPSGSSDCDAFLKLFGRGVLCGLIPIVPIRVNEVKEPKINVTIRTTPGTVIDGHGCVKVIGNELHVTSDLIGFEQEFWFDGGDIRKLLETMRSRGIGGIHKKMITKERVAKSLSDAVITVIVSEVTKQVPKTLKDLETGLNERLNVSLSDAPELWAAILQGIWEVRKSRYVAVDSIYYLDLISPRSGSPYLEIKNMAPSQNSPIFEFALSVNTQAGLKVPNANMSILAVDPFSFPFKAEPATDNVCIDKQKEVWAGYASYECPQDNEDGAVRLATIGVFGNRVWICPDAREQIVAPALINALIAANRPKVFDDVKNVCKSPK